MFTGRVPICFYTTWHLLRKQMCISCTDIRSQPWNPVSWSHPFEMWTSSLAAKWYENAPPKNALIRRFLKRNQWSRSSLYLVDEHFPGTSKHFTLLQRIKLERTEWKCWWNESLKSGSRVTSLSLAWCTEQANSVKTFLDELHSEFNLFLLV